MPHINLAGYHILPDDLIGKKLDEINTNLTPELIRNWKRGDIISTEKSGFHYRNDGKLIFDGTEVQYLNYEIDDYGSIPEEFKAIEEFPPNYWQYLIDHNEFINVDYDKLGIKKELFEAIVSGKHQISFKFKEEDYTCDLYTKGDCEMLVFKFYFIEPEEEITSDWESPRPSGTVILLDSQHYPTKISATRKEINTFRCTVPFKSYPIYHCWITGAKEFAKQLLSTMDKTQVLEEAQTLYYRNRDYEQFIVAYH